MNGCCFSFNQGRWERERVRPEHKMWHGPNKLWEFFLVSIWMRACIMCHIRCARVKYQTSRVPDFKSFCKKRKKKTNYIKCCTAFEFLYVYVSNKRARSRLSKTTSQETRNCLYNSVNMLWLKLRSRHIHEHF